jgi:hypothetical protein
LIVARIDNGDPRGDRMERIEYIVVFMRHNCRWYFLKGKHIVF